MKFAQSPESVDGVIGWVAVDGDLQYVISFDNKFPDLGYRCSWAERSGERPEPHYLPDAYPSFANARQACEVLHQPRLH